MGSKSQDHTQPISTSVGTSNDRPDPSRQGVGEQSEEGKGVFAKTWESTRNVVAVTSRAFLHFCTLPRGKKVGMKIGTSGRQKKSQGKDNRRKLKSQKGVKKTVPLAQKKKSFSAENQGQRTEG